MHLQTHFLSGWCLGNYVDLTARERFLCMIAAGISDLDGLGILWDIQFYLDYHHILCHNLAFALGISFIFAGLSTHRFKMFLITLAMVHLHLFLDFLGSGAGWGIPYFWPKSRHFYENPWVWDLYSWQNSVAMLFLAGWTFALLHLKKRSPFEFIWPRLESKIIGYIRKVEENYRASRSPAP
jgi:inner membrane protein